MELVVKAVVSGVIVALASEAAQRSTLLGAILVSLPLTSILALTWLYADTGDRGAVVDLSWSILWVIVPSLVFFVALPALVRMGAGIPVALAGAAAVTAVAYAVWVWGANRLGLHLS